MIGKTLVEGVFFGTLGVFLAIGEQQRPSGSLFDRSR
jgi:hypothetical protein